MTKKKDKTDTPMMRQYKRIKSEHTDKILFFRMGDFYEMFGEDAKVASKVLDLVLTTRSKDKDAIPLAGLPYHSVDTYLARMLKAGYKVAICEQVEDPAQAKGVVKRAVTRIVTPGTLIDESLISYKKNNYITALFRNRDTTGVSLCDISTGELSAGEFPSGQVLDILAAYEPSECVFAEQKDEELDYLPLLRERYGCTLTPWPDYSFCEDTGLEDLKKHLQVSSLMGYGMDEDMETAPKALAGLFSYLLDTQRGVLGQITSLRKISRDNYMILDRTSLQNLEIFSSRGERGTSLIEAVDNTVTAPGARLLRDWVRQPLTNVREIKSRLKCVEELVNKTDLLDESRTVLGSMFDMERLITRISCRRANARDLISLAKSLAAVPKLAYVLRDADSGGLKRLNDEDSYNDIVQEIQRIIRDDAPALVREGNMINTGVDEELDELRSIRDSGKDWISNLQKRLIEETGIPKLKVGYNRVFGYYIEITRLHAAKAPESFIRKQTLVNAERFITPELKEYEAKVLGADERIKKLEFKLFEQLQEKISGFISPIQKTSRKTAEIDVYSSFATSAARWGHTRPAVTSEKDLLIREGRHPVLEQTLGESAFVPNDTVVRYQDNQITIVTGPNMSGKSTYIRQVALIVLMAQIGAFVPAREASIGVADRIFTRVGASDDLSLGHSTFMVEMTEVANILNNATDRSLVILDEVGRGTSTYDGVSLAWAITEYLHNNTRVAARTIFATHYHELTQLEELFDRISNCNVNVKEWKNQIIFLHKITPGATDRSYGIHVAKLAGVPSPVLRRAEEILQGLESGNTSNTVIAGHELPAVKKDKQLTLFETPDERVNKTLRDIDINNMTPVQALLKLQELRDMAKKS